MHFDAESHGFITTRWCFTLWKKVFHNTMSSVIYYFGVLGTGGGRLILRCY